VFAFLSASLFTAMSRTFYDHSILLPERNVFIFEPVLHAYMLAGNLITQEGSNKVTKYIRWLGEDRGSFFILNYHSQGSSCPRCCGNNQIVLHWKDDTNSTGEIMG
jgi:hypothetical protein